MGVRVMRRKISPVATSLSAATIPRAAAATAVPAAGTDAAVVVTFLRVLAAEPRGLSSSFSDCGGCGGNGGGRKGRSLLCQRFGRRGIPRDTPSARAGGVVVAVAVAVTVAGTRRRASLSGVGCCLRRRVRERRPPAGAGAYPSSAGPRGSGDVGRRRGVSAIW